MRRGMGQLSEGEKKKYEKAAKKDKERYKEELEEFNEKGYYTPNKKGSEKKETQSQKKMSKVSIFKETII